MRHRSRVAERRVAETPPAIRSRTLAAAVSAALLASALLLAGCSPAAQKTAAAKPTPAPVELNVSAATSLKDVLETTAAEFESANDVKLVFNFAASGVLQKQIEGGAPADVFVSASPKQVDELIEGGLISAETSSAVAGNDIVIFVPRGNPARIATPEDLAKANRLVTGNPDTAPHGTKAKEWLEGLGTWDELGSNFVFAENAAQTLDYVARGEVDAGIGFASEAKGNDAVEIVYTVPKDVIKPVEYVAAPLAGSSNAERAAAYVVFLESPSVQSALTAAGFLPASTK